MVNKDSTIKAEGAKSTDLKSVPIIFLVAGLGFEGAGAEG